MSSQAAIRELLTSGALSALLDGALCALYFVLLLGAAPLLAACALVFALLQAGSYLVVARRSAELMVEGLSAQARLEAFQVEMLAGVESLKAMNATDRSMQRWGDLYVSALNRALARGMLGASFDALLGVLRFCGPLCLVLAGAYQVLHGTLSLGAMLSLATLGAGFLDPIANLIATAMKLTQLQGYMERIEDVLDAPREAPPARPEQQRAFGAAPPVAIRVEQLAFTYPGEAQPVLKDIAFEVSPGECVAVVGASGSGKSTLARLLAGLYQPQTGGIHIDGRDLRAWELHDLRDRFGIVTQDTRLFSGTLRDNVTLFEPDVPQTLIDQACEQACLREVIERLPMGYDTMLADGGSSLSGGQRQRLALARALLRQPALLILDEATSALDTASERRVQDQLRALDCTRVVVAHRLSTVVEADKILVLSDGRIVDNGTHAQLVVRCFAYRELLRAQTPEPKPEVARKSGPVAAPQPGPTAMTASLRAQAVKQRLQATSAGVRTANVMRVPRTSRDGTV
jgi:ABC-type bacteriocin/lantibiotic exporter with double-glycine peptidase domain